MKGLNWLFIIIIIIIIIISSSSSSISSSSSSVLIASTFLLLHSTRYSKINIMYGCSYMCMLLLVSIIRAVQWF